MSYSIVYPVDPMVAFYAAVTAIESGKVAEIEIEYRYMKENDEVALMTTTLRREPQPNIIFAPIENGEEE